MTPRKEKVKMPEEKVYKIKEEEQLNFCIDRLRVWRQGQRTAVWPMEGLGRNICGAEACFSLFPC